MGCVTDIWDSRNKRSVTVWVHIDELKKNSYECRRRSRMYGLKDRFDRWVSMNGGFTRDMVNVRKVQHKEGSWCTQERQTFLVEYHPTLVKEKDDGADK